MSWGLRSHWRLVFVAHSSHVMTASAPLPPAAKFVFQNHRPQIFWLKMCAFICCALSIAHRPVGKQFYPHMCAVLGHLGRRERGLPAEGRVLYTEEKAWGQTPSLCGFSSSRLALMCFASVRGFRFLAPAGAPSLVLQSPLDPVFPLKHPSLSGDFTREARWGVRGIDCHTEHVWQLPQERNKYCAWGRGEGSGRPLVASGVGRGSTEVAA